MTKRNDCIFVPSRTNTSKYRALHWYTTPASYHLEPLHRLPLVIDALHVEQLRETSQPRRRKMFVGLVAIELCPTPIAVVLSAFDTCHLPIGSVCGRSASRENVHDCTPNVSQRAGRSQGRVTLCSSRATRGTLAPPHTPSPTAAAYCARNAPPSFSARSSPRRGPCTLAK